MATKASIESLQAEKQLYVLTIANNDLVAANTALDLILELGIKNKSDKRYTPLIHSFVIAYGRPFKKSRGYQPLTGPSWPGFTNGVHKVFHQKLMTWRDKIVAHSDAELRTTTIYPPGNSIPGVASIESNWRVATLNRNLNLDDIPIVKIMCNDLRARINAERNRIFKSAVNGRMRPFQIHP